MKSTNITNIESHDIKMFELQMKIESLEEMIKI